MSTFRGVQTNILHSRNIEHRYQLFREALLEVKPDFVTAQEVSNSELYVEELDKAGVPHTVVSNPSLRKGDKYSLAISSKTPISVITDTAWFLVASTEVKGVDVVLISAHLPWGSHSESARLREATLIEEFARKVDYCPVILGGDLNALPESRTLRFFKGLDLGAENYGSTYWVDAWDEAGTSDNWATTIHSKNTLGRETAINAGVYNPDYLPPRRIDYFLTRGWCYGKPGYPINFDYLRHSSGEDITDHEGIVVDFVKNYF